MRRAAASSLVLAAALVASIGARARGDADPAGARPRWVTDRAGFLSAATASDLDARLDGYARRTGHQVLVYIDHTTGGVPIEDWGVRAFERWRVGRKGIDDGVVLFVFTDDHRAAHRGRLRPGGSRARRARHADHRRADRSAHPRRRSRRRGPRRRRRGDRGDRRRRRRGARSGRATGAAPIPLWLKIVGGAVLPDLHRVRGHPSVAGAG